MTLNRNAKIDEANIAAYTRSVDALKKDYDGTPIGQASTNALLTGITLLVGIREELASIRRELVRQNDIENNRKL